MPPFFDTCDVNWVRADFFCQPTPAPLSAKPRNIGGKIRFYLFVREHFYHAPIVTSMLVMEIAERGVCW